LEADLYQILRTRRGHPLYIPLPGWRSLILARPSASFRGVSMGSDIKGIGLTEEEAEVMADFYSLAHQDGEVVGDKILSLSKRDVIASFNLPLIS
jgi:hypothetical protein